MSRILLRLRQLLNDNSESEAEQILSKMVKQYHAGDKVRIDGMDVLNYLFPNIGGKEIYMSNDDSNALGVIKAIYNGAKDQFEKRHSFTGCLFSL